MSKRIFIVVVLLGLLLAHGLSRVLDTELTVRSTEGEGSTFSLTWP